MTTTAVAERRYTPGQYTAAKAQNLTMHAEGLVPILEPSADADAVVNASVGRQQVEGVQQQVSAMALSVVPDLQEALLMLRQQSIEAQQATRAQMMLAEEVQQLRHELRALSTTFDRRVPEPADPNAGWERLTHPSFRSAEFPHGRQYWIHMDGRTQWERPEGVLSDLDETSKLRADGDSTTIPGQIGDRAELPRPHSWVPGSDPAAGVGA